MSHNRRVPGVFPGLSQAVRCEIPGSLGFANVVAPAPRTHQFLTTVNDASLCERHATVQIANRD